MVGAWFNVAFLFADNEKVLWKTWIDEVAPWVQHPKVLSHEI